MKPKTRFIAAAVQSYPVFLDINKTIEKVEALVREAHKNGATLIAFPEAMVSAYPYWVWLESPLEWRRKYTKVFFESAIELEGPYLANLCRIAKRHQSYLVIGINEKFGGTIYNSQLFISEDGKLNGLHRKLVPTFAERSVWGRGDGSTLNTFKTSFGVIGGLICAENNMPLARYALLSQDEEIHVACFPAFPFKGAVLPYQADIAVRNHAIEGQVFVINSSSYLPKDVIDQLCDTEDKRSRLQKEGNGFSSIVNPLGHYLAGPLLDQEGILYAEIDKSEIHTAKQTLDAIGHTSRPDVLTLLMNKKAYQNLYVEASGKGTTPGSNLN